VGVEISKFPNQLSLDSVDPHHPDQWTALNHNGKAAMRKLQTKSKPASAASAVKPRSKKAVRRD